MYTAVEARFCVESEFTAIILPPFECLLFKMVVQIVINLFENFFIFLWNVTYSQSFKTFIVMINFGKCYALIITSIFISTLHNYTQTVNTPQSKEAFRHSNNDFT